MPPPKKKAQDERKTDISAKMTEIKEQRRKWMEEKKMADESGHGEPVFGGTKTYSHSHYSSTNSNAGRSNEVNQVTAQMNSRLSFKGPKSPAGSTMSSHQCPSCHSTMVAPHSPCMLIPCGHNLCELCCRDTGECAICGVEVASVTSNVMLEQVILHSHSSTTSSSGYSPAKYEAADSYGNDNEIQTLTLRKEMLEEEISEVEQKIRGIEKRNQSDESQIEGIERSERHLMNEIADIQKKILSLQTHKQDFKDKIRTQNLQINAEEKKINLIRQTVGEIESKLTNL